MGYQGSVGLLGWAKDDSVIRLLGLGSWDRVFVLSRARGFGLNGVWDIQGGGFRPFSDLWCGVQELRLRNLILGSVFKHLFP